MEVSVSGTETLTYTQAWNAENRLAVVTNTVSGEVTRFVYNGDGQRVLREDAAGLTAYIGAIEVRISATERVTTSYCFAGGQRIAMRRKGELTYLHGDHLGSASLATDATGAQISALRYRPFGETRYGDAPTDRRFTGQREESSLGLGVYDYNARFYSAGLGRFLSADTIVPGPGNPQALNRYAYVLNNALKYTDPSGYAYCPPEAGSRCIDDLPAPRSPSPTPNTRYYYSEKYGWFDLSHIGTGKPRQIIQEVRRLIAGGGGVVPIEQNVRAGPITLIYQGRYQISAEARPEDTIGIAYGIYQDWSHRFEKWQGTMAFGRGKKTSFAVEDLPSHHIGFYTAAYHVSVSDIFEALGGGEGTNAEPLRNVKNHTFEPVVRNAEGQYERVPWPDWMTVTPIGSGQNTWTFVDDRCLGVFCFLSGW